LIPQGLAIELTPSVEKKMKQQLKSKDKHNRELIENRHKIAEDLSGKTLKFSLKT
jgi:ribosomal protein L9